MSVLAIDPGNAESAYALIDEDRSPIWFDKVPNDDLLGEWTSLARRADVVAIEMVASYGMAVGADVFETCVWIGRFVEAERRRSGRLPELIKRNPVKAHHCHSSKANDSNVKQALVDRFASGVRNHGKGTKADPGWFYGFRADVWQAYALAVYVADTRAGHRSMNLKPAICPECRDGKCRNCDGTAWSDETDFPTTCECENCA